MKQDEWRTEEKHDSNHTTLSVGTIKTWCRYGWIFPLREPKGTTKFGRSWITSNRQEVWHRGKAPAGRADSARSATVVVLDMAAVVHMVRPTSAKTFADYATQHIVPFLEHQITPTVERIDAIWDNYPEDNLKSLTHQRRGAGPRTRIGDGHTQIPKHEWNSGFLKNEENKQELFSYLSEEIVKKDLGGKLLLSTKCERVLSNRPCDVSALEPCNHSEADTRIFLHLAHASWQGPRQHMLEPLTVISSSLPYACSQRLVCWSFGLASGVEKTFAIFPSMISAPILDLPDLLRYHFSMPSQGATQRHTSLAVARRRQNMPGLTETLLALTNAPSCFSLESLHMEKLERFVVVMYSKGCGLAKVNEARHRLFTSGKKTLESIPPSQAALFEHIKRALLQASFYWNQATSVHQEIPYFREWGWQREDSGVWLPYWTTLQDASKACSILLHCSCERSCTGNCKCSRAGVRCTGLCKCESGCVNNDDT